MMPRIETFRTLKCGAKVREITVTWNRDEVLARVKAVNTFKHKRLIVRSTPYVDVQ